MGQPLNDPTIEDPEVDPIVGGEDPEDEAEFVPPTKEEWEKQRADLVRARAQAKKLREAQEKKPATDPAAADNGAETEKWKAVSARSAARAALVAEGVNPDVASVVAQNIKSSQVIWDEDDDADVSEWLERQREKRPGIFNTKTTNRQRPAKLNRGNGSGPSQDSKLSFGERVMKTSKTTG